MSQYQCPKCKEFKLRYADSDDMYACMNCNYWWYTEELT